MTARILAAGPLMSGLLFVMYSSGAVAEEQHASPLEDDRGTVSFVYENDWVGNSDRNYTNGVRLSYVSKAIVPDGLTETIADRILNTEDGSRVRWGAALGHSLFTPDDIEAPQPLPDQHPYAAWLYGEFSVFAEKTDRIDQFTLQLGVVGPDAGGEWVQNEVHDIVGAPQARGWDNQIGNEVGVVLSYDRRYRAMRSLNIGSLGTDISPSFGISVGNVQTNARAGVMVRLGEDLRSDYGPSRVRPSLAGADYFAPQDNFSWYVFGGVEARAVAHNIFIDGSLFRDSDNDLARRALVGDIQFGVAWQIYGTQFGITFVERTDQFKGQSSPHRFGSFSIARKL